ncbi:ZN574 protein, partial [Catharus fuscescens]|nr:ZN574 protein [Catharus fuscescens]
MTKFLYHRRSHAAPGPLPLPEPPLDPPNPGLACGMCPKSFPNAAALSRHQRFVHRLERRHRC